MKQRKTYCIPGLGIIFAILVALIPSTPASASELISLNPVEGEISDDVPVASSQSTISPSQEILEWAEINSPGSAGSAASFVIADCDIIDIEIADDGTMFAAVLAEGYVPAVGTAYLAAGEYGILKSTTGGTTWMPTGFTPVNIVEDQIVDIAASQAYSEDATLWVALAGSVQRTINGGITFGNITPAILGVGETITSIDVAPDYLGTGVNAVIGTAKASGAEVLLFTERTMSWEAVDPVSFGAWDRAWVALSPAYLIDGEIIAVCSKADLTQVRFSFQERAWDSEVLPTVPLQQENTGVNIVAMDVSIAFPDDYDALSAINLFVGIDTGAAADGDAFWIVGQGMPGPFSTAVDLNAHPSEVFDIHSIAVSGAMDDLTVLVGAADSNDVRESTNATSNVPSWQGATKRPTGASNSVVKVASDYATSGTVYAATSGDESALSRATGGGSIFNGISLIDTPIVAMVDVAAASKDVIFLITSDLAPGPESLWRTTNGGGNWERVLATVQTNGMNSVVVSPEYAEDSTLYTAHVGDTRIWKSSNGGDTFNGVSARENIAVFVVVNSSTLYVAADTTEIWRSSNSGLRWTRSEEKPAGVANTIAISPNFEADDSILVGTVNGRVYLSQDSGLNFSRVGAANPGGAAGPVYSTFDSNYHSNGILYAAVQNAAQSDVEGIYRWKAGESTAWDQININLADPLAAPPVPGLEARALVLSDDGILYASDAIPGRGMQRSALPAAPPGIVEASFQTVSDGLIETASLVDLEAVPGGSTILFAVDAANNQLGVLRDPGAPPHLDINPSSGPAGTGVTITGACFAAYETGIAVTWDNIDILTGITADENGSWGPETFYVPLGTTIGDHILDAYGDVTTIAECADAYFTVTVIVEIGSTTLFAGQSSSVDIRVRDYPAVPGETEYGLGSYTIRVDFDAALLEVTGVLPGSAPFDAPGYNLYADYVTITQSSTVWPGPYGDIGLCALQFNCLAEGTAILCLTVEELSDVNGTALATTAVDGVISQLPVEPLPPVAVEVQSAIVIAGSSSSVDIWVKGYLSIPDETEYGLGAYTIRIDFDPAMIEVTGVSPGDTPFDAPTHNILPGYINITQFHTEWPGPDGDIKLCSLQFNCLAEGVTTLELTVQTLSNVNGDAVSNLPLDGVITQVLYEVEIAIAEEQELDGVVVIPVTIVRVKDPATEETVTGVQISGYMAGMGFPMGFMEILEIRGGDPPFDSTPDWQTTGNWIDINEDISPAGIEPPVTIFRTVASLTGSCNVSEVLRVSALASHSGGGPMPAQYPPVVLTLQRGDVNGNGEINIIDAMFGAQYVVGLRPVEDIRQLNLASVKRDGGGDKKDIVDCMFIAQYVVGIRDEYFQLPEVATLRYATHLPPTSELAGADTWFFNEVTRLAGGRINMDYYYNGILFHGRDMLDAVSQGIVDCAFIDWRYTPGRLSLSEGFDLGYLAHKPDALGLAVMELYDTFTPLQEEWEVENNVKVLYYLPDDTVALATSHKSVCTIADLKGLKLGTYGSQLADLIKAMGASPVNIPISDVYEALERGVIDGAYLTFYDISSYGLFEVTDYIAETWAGPCTNYATVINRDVWDSLPEDIKNLMEELSDDALVHYLELMTGTNRVAVDQLVTAGVSFNIWPESERENAESIAQSIIQSWIDDTDARGLPGSEFIAALQELLAIYGPQSTYQTGFDIWEQEYGSP